MTNVNKWHRRGNLRGHHFKATAMPEPPYISMIDQELGTLDGSFVELLKMCSKWMNFTYTLEPPPDKKWGGLQKDGSWNGMIGLLKDEHVDIGNRARALHAYTVSPQIACICVQRIHCAIRNRAI